MKLVKPFRLTFLQSQCPIFATLYPPFLTICPVRHYNLCQYPFLHVLKTLFALGQSPLNLDDAANMFEIALPSSCFPLFTTIGPKSQSSLIQCFPLNNLFHHYLSSNVHQICSHPCGYTQYKPLLLQHLHLRIYFRLAVGTIPLGTIVSSSSSGTNAEGNFITPRSKLWYSFHNTSITPLPLRSSSSIIHFPSSDVFDSREALAQASSLRLGESPRHTEQQALRILAQASLSSPDRDARSLKN